MREGDQQPEATPVSRDTACDPAPPDGWIAYTIQSGDNLSTLAISSGGSVTEVAAANCMTDTRIIVVGQRIYLPAQPVRPTAQPTFAFTDEPMRPTITEQPTQGRDQSGQRDGGGNDGGDRQRQREQEQRPPANDAGGEDSGVRGR
jgi:hypothetical protein